MTIGKGFVTQTAFKKHLDGDWRTVHELWSHIRNYMTSYPAPAATTYTKTEIDAFFEGYSGGKAQVDAGNVVGLTQGSIPFADASGFLTEDNSKLTWADATGLDVDGNISIRNSKELRFYDNGNYVGFEAPALDADQIWVLPAVDGAANEVLGTDGGGALIWRDHGELAGLADKDHLLNKIGNPDGNVLFTMVAKQIKFNWLNPQVADGAMELEASGNFAGDLLHIHQHTGAPGAGTHLIHLESTHANVVPLYITGAATYDIISGPISVESINSMVVSIETTDNYVFSDVVPPNLSGAAANVFIGKHAGDSLTSGDRNIFIGEEAGEKTTTVSDCVMIGYRAGQDSVGASQVCIGTNAGFNITSGNRQIIIGHDAGAALTTGHENVLIGYKAGNACTTSDNVMIGTGAGEFTTSGSSNVYLGWIAGYANVQGLQNVVIGFRAGQGAAGQTWSQNVFIGADAGRIVTTGGNNVCIGASVGPALTSGSFNVFIGYLAGNALSTQSGNTFVGSQCGMSVTGAGNTAYGNYALRAGTGAGVYNVAVGQQCLTNASAQSFNTAVGFGAGLNQNTGSSNQYFGYHAGYSDDSSGNTSIGYQAGYYKKAGSNYNVSIGHQTGIGNISTVHTHNVCIGGYRAGYVNIGSYNIMIGSYCGDAITSGANNVLIGYKAGSSLTTHAGNVMIGYSAGENATAANTLYIANSNTATPLIYGEFDNAYLLINGRLAVAFSTIGDDERGLSSIHTLSDNPAKSDGIGFYSEGHIGAITTDGPTYGAGIWLNIDAGATLGADVRALDIGIYEAGATCDGVNAYGLAIHMEFDDTNPPAAIYPFRINCNDTPGHATPDALIFAPNRSAIALTDAAPGTADAYLKVVLQDGSVYRIPLVKE